MINENTLEIQFQYTANVAVTSVTEVANSVSIINRILPWVSICLLSIIVFFWIIGIATAKSIFPAIFIIILILDPFIKRFRARINFKKNPSANTIVKYYISDDGVDIFAEGSTSFCSWDKIYRIEKRKKGFLIFPQVKLAYWIPISEISNALSNPKENYHIWVLHKPLRYLPI